MRLHPWLLPGIILGTTGLVGLAGTTPAAAAGHALVICNVGGPGTTKQAQPVLDRFLRHMEQASGLKSGSMTGEYHTTRQACLDYIKQHGPAFGVFELATYLSQAQALKLRPLASMGKPDGTRYHLLVREASDYAALKDLRGKTLISSLLDDLTFVSKIIFAGAVDAGVHFKIARTGLPLKGLRKVAREQADAALVDNVAYEHLGELTLPHKLKSIFASAGLPGLTMASLDGGKGADDAVKKVIKALPRLCTGEGQKMCQTFNIAAFHPVKPALYQKLVRAYTKK